MRRASESTSSLVAWDGPLPSSPAKGWSCPSAGRTVNGPIRSDMPHRPTICRAIRLACSRSDSAPVVVSP